MDDSAAGSPGRQSAHLARGVFVPALTARTRWLDACDERFRKAAFRFTVPSANCLHHFQFCLSRTGKPTFHLTFRSRTPMREVMLNGFGPRFHQSAPPSRILDPGRQGVGLAHQRQDIKMGRRSETLVGAEFKKGSGFVVRASGALTESARQKKGQELPASAAVSTTAGPRSLEEVSDGPVGWRARIFGFLPSGIGGNSGKAAVLTEASQVRRLVRSRTCALQNRSGIALFHANWRRSPK